MQALDNLSNQVWMTYKSRHNAASRLKNKHSSITFSISFLSVLQVIISIALIFNITFFMSYQVLSFVALATSIAILVIANQDHIGNLGLKSNNYHKCANTLHELYNKIELLRVSPTLALNNYVMLLEQYTFILNNFDLNHETIDYKKILADRHEHFKLNSFDVFTINIRFLASEYGLALLYCSIPFLVMAAACWAT